MTVTTPLSKVGPIAGNGLATVFSFAPIVLPESSADLTVIFADENGIETTLVEGTGPANYSVSVPSYPGTGSITYPASGTGTLLSTQTITIKRALELEQNTRLSNQGGYFPDVQEAVFDRLTMIDIQQQEEIDRCVKVDLSSGEDPNTFLQTVLQNVADSEANAQAAADALFIFQSQYLGALTANPTVDGHGNPVTDGDLYFNTTTSKLRVFGGGLWADSAVASPVNFTQNLFSGTGSQTAFTLSTTPASVASVLVTIAGVVQRPTTDFTVSGTTLTFGTAPTAATNNVQALVVSSLSIGVPADGTVTPAKLSMGVGTAAGNLVALDANGKLTNGLAGFVVGQCVLVKNSTNLSLFPAGGNQLLINGLFRTVPAAGVNLAPTGLTPGTKYYIYAFMSGSTMTLEASTTGYVTTTTPASKSGDATRTLVGMAVPTTGPAWVDTFALRQVLSWFNQRRKGFHTNNAVAGAISLTTSFAEKSASRVLALNWVNSAVDVRISAQFNAGGVASLFSSAIYIDLAQDVTTTNSGGTISGQSYGCSAASVEVEPAEGNHTYSLGGGTNTGTASMTSWTISGSVFG